ncbi:MAG TPA: hypothetical protein V6D08_12670 [Candidatus Obscuribacterales bacterium]
MKRCKKTILLVLVILLAVPEASAARKPWPDSPLPVESQVSLERAGKLMKSGKYEKAEPLILAELERSNDIPKCLAIAAFTEAYATPMMEVRRQCLQKALSLCQTRQDFIQVALKSRQYQFFEITRQAINSLIQNANSIPDLYDLARKAQEVALNDVAHLAMERAYSGVRNVPDAIKFASECKAMGMEDLVRKVYRALIDDENSAHYLCQMLPQLEPLGQADLNRALLKKALDKAMTVDEFLEIYEAARRNREQDIFKLAEYRGKKLRLIQQIKRDQEAYQRQLQSWQEGVQQDLSRQQAEADRGSASGGGSAGGDAGGGSAGGGEASAPAAPASGF